MANIFRKIRFIGYAIPTTPAKLVSIGNSSGPGSVAGTYLANPDLEIDMRDRTLLLKHAVDLAKKQLSPKETGVINVFVAPEFFYHSPEGPYIYDDPAQDPLDFLRQHLAETFNAADYPDWLFICGSAITTLVKDIDALFASNSVKTRNNVVHNLADQWQGAFGPLQGVIFDMLINFIKNCHSYPNCEIRNRAVIVSNIPIRPPEVDTPTNLMTTEKYYVSNEDLLLYDVTGKQVITEQMTAYPPIDLSGGDAKQYAFDEYAIFRQDNIDPNNPGNTSVTDYGVEICLDHSDTRLRRNINNEPSVIGGIHVQLIPSCGMQISLPSVAVGRNGLVFNCDGEYRLKSGDCPCPPDTPDRGQAVINGVDSLYADYCCVKEEKAGKNDEKKKKLTYEAHSQLARVMTPAQGGDPNAPGSTNATFATLDEANIQVIPVVRK
ncbi:MAG: hypothetical protein D3910_05375 [Candidatus Electrothrix sp. ATG2]|nr:hypothetical protein [Candidatus Electrothrix sp. ATG2]